MQDFALEQMEFALRSGTKTGTLCAGPGEMGIRGCDL